ncbi:MAG: Hpt domain-containing protein, partial [Lachnospiraceae bacterium]|nr:Hpt domain-containing protein [Lachnospiraceae bacterium]
CIALTANAVAGTKEQLLKEGFNDYLAKPVEGKDLEQMLIKHLPKDKLLPDDRKIGIDDLKDMKELDIEEAMKYCLEEEIFVEAMGSYIEDMEETIDTLERLEKEKNIKDLTTRMHAIKSSSRTVGLISLSEKAADIEKMGKEERFDEMEKELPSFKEEYITVCKKLRALDFSS